MADGKVEGWDEQGGPLLLSIGMQGGMGAGNPVVGRCWPKE